MDDEIGYNIPSRVSVASVLGLHMLLVLGAGLILANRKSLHLLAVVVPVAALLATGSLIAMGNQKTSSVPSTIAIGQVARAIPDSSEVRIDSMAAIYSQEERDLDIRSSHGTTTTLLEESTGEVKRVVWDDSGESYWMFVQQPPGVVRHVSSQSTVTIPTPWSVQGRFTENGFEGLLSGLESAKCEDPVIVSSASPSMGVAMVATSGEIRSTSEDVLNPGQFIDSALMSDVQQSRQELLRDLIGPETTVVNANPSLLVWTTPLDAGVEFSKDFQRRGSLLASIPISMQRQGEGSKFLIPPGFVRLEAYKGARGMSMVYNELTGQWVGTDKASESELRCVLPKVVLPCELEKATIEIKISAPLRTVEVKGFVDGEFQTLFSRDSPTGLISYEMTDPAALQLDSEGGLLMGIAISATEEELQTQGRTGAAAAGPSQDDWQIDYFHVTLHGVTQ